MPKGKRPHIVLCANRRAGWRFEQWSALDQWSLKAGIRTYALSEIEELDPVIARFDDETLLLLVYGGDGTLLQIINSLLRRKRRKDRPKPKMPIIVPIGGGTMKRLSLWTMWTDDPAHNAEVALKLFESQRLPRLPLTLQKVEWGRNCVYGVTFIGGVPARILGEYSKFKTTPFIAGGFVLGSVAAAWLGWPERVVRLFESTKAKVVVDGKELPYDEWLAVVRDGLKRLIFVMEPYRGEIDTRDTDKPCATSYTLAYAVNYREAARKFGGLCFGRVPPDERYFNQPTAKMSITSEEETIFSLDGELFTAKGGETISVSQGPVIQVAMNPTLQVPFLNRLLDQKKRLGEALSIIFPVPKSG